MQVVDFGLPELVRHLPLRQQAGKGLLRSADTRCARAHDDTDAGGADGCLQAFYALEHAVLLQSEPRELIVTAQQVRSVTGKVDPLDSFDTSDPRVEVATGQIVRSQARPPFGNGLPHRGQPDTGSRSRRVRSNFQWIHSSTRRTNSQATMEFSSVRIPAARIIWNSGKGVAFRRPAVSDSATKSLRLLNHLNRAYRFAGQSLLWITFGLVGAAVSLIVLPLILLFERDGASRQARARAVIAGCFGWFISVACLLRVISCHVTGTEHYEPDSSQLILANHPSLIDVVILISLFPQVDCVIKEAVTRNPVMGPSVRGANYISNFDPAALLVSCVERLRAGNSLLLFPEGTRTAPGEPLKFKPGAAEIAIRAEATILPVVIHCRPTFLTKNDPWYRVPPARPHFEVRILPPLQTGDLVSDEAGTKRARATLNAALEQLFEARLA